MPWKRRCDEFRVFSELLLLLVLFWSVILVVCVCFRVCSGRTSFLRGRMCWNPVLVLGESWFWSIWRIASPVGVTPRLCMNSLLQGLFYGNSTIRTQLIDCGDMLFCPSHSHRRCEFRSSFWKGGPSCGKCVGCKRTLARLDYASKEIVTSQSHFSFLFFLPVCLYICRAS